MEEEAGVGLNQHRKLFQSFRNAVGAEGANIPVHMGDDGGEPTVGIDTLEFFIHGVGPAGVGHLDKDAVMAFDGQIIQNVRGADAAEEVYLRAELQPGHALKVCHGLTKHFRGPGPALKEAAGIVPVGVEVGRGHHRLYALHRLHPQHFQRLLKACAAVVDAGEDVRVKIYYHKICSGPEINQLFCSFS